MSERVYIEPQPTPETQAFWEAAKQGRFTVKGCRECGRAHWYPRSHCPFCTSVDTEWTDASGEGTIYSFSVMRRATPQYVMAYVTLAEGPTMMTNIVDCEPETLRIGDPVSVVFVHTAEGHALPSVSTPHRRNPMIDKRVATTAEALAGVKDGSVVLVGGFGQVGHPMALIDGLIEQGATDLTIVCNNAGVGTSGLPRLMKLGRVRKIVCSYPRTAAVFTELYSAGRLELEITPQGTLAERIRAGGAGIGGFYTRTGAGTLLAQGKETRDIDGLSYVFEKPLKGDVALIEAWEGDRWGNLTYRGSGQNFNPVMATAAAMTVAQVQKVRELGEILPNDVATPSIFVDRLIEIAYEPPYPAISY